MKKIFCVLLLACACSAPAPKPDLVPAAPLPPPSSLSTAPMSAPKMCLKFLSAFCHKAEACFEVSMDKCMIEALAALPCEEARDVDPRQLELCLLGVERLDCVGAPPKACKGLVGFDAPVLDLDVYKL